MKTPFIILWNGLCWLFRIAVTIPTFLITLPIDYPMWQEYKRQDYDVPNYCRFFWDRNIAQDWTRTSYKKRENTGGHNYYD